MLGAASIPKPAKRAKGSQHGDESYFLLLEFSSQEPTVQNCYKIIESTCLAQSIEIRIRGRAISNKFQQHVDRHYMPFCEAAIRHMFTCGFVPWRLRRLATGDPVPEVIPLGIFTWTVRCGSDERHDALGTRLGTSFERQSKAIRRARKPRDNEGSKLLLYQIHFTENCGVSEDDVEIYEFVPPTNNVTHNSMMYRTVPSPMSHLLVDYRNLRQAMIRKGFADTWNTQAKMVCSYQTAKNPYGVNEGNPITNDWTTPQNRLGLTTDTNLPSEIEQNAYARDAITETLVSSKGSDHRPTVYTLPKNTRLEPVQVLTSSVDTDSLNLKLAKDITSIMGIPFELVGGGYSSKQGEKKALENSRVFTTNMMKVCRHLQELLKDVYQATYGGPRNHVDVFLRSTPRIEVSTVDDIVKLLDTGIVSTGMAAGLSRMLLGMDTEHHITGEQGNAFVTSKNRGRAAA